jgi:hypothetical protein
MGLSIGECGVVVFGGSLREVGIGVDAVGLVRIALLVSI